MREFGTSRVSRRPTGPRGSAPPLGGDSDPRSTEFPNGTLHLLEDRHYPYRGCPHNLRAIKSCARECVGSFLGNILSMTAISSTPVTPTRTRYGAANHIQDIPRDADRITSLNEKWGHSPSRHLRRRGWSTDAKRTLVCTCSDYIVRAIHHIQS